MPQDTGKILAAVQECRRGKLTRPVVETLHDAGLICAVCHGAPQTSQFILINFKSTLAREAVEVFKKKDFLPEQVSFRLAARTFGIDAIISGQLPVNWFKEEVVDKDVFAKYILDYCYLNYTEVLRYRWQQCMDQTPFLDPQIDPSIDDVQLFMEKDPASTRLTYDLSKLPILSAYALIKTETTFKSLWNILGKEFQKPVRDLYHNAKDDKDNFGAFTLNKDEIKSQAEYFAVCEFDNFTSVNDKNDYSIASAMNAMADWRSAVMNLKGIKEVSMIPCVVVKESYESLDEAGRLKIFKPAVSLTARSQYDENATRSIPFPVWTSLICGGPRSGKSMTAYYILASLLKGDPAHDVIFVNFKASARDNEGNEPAMVEAVEFARIIQECTKQQVRLVKPQKLEEDLTESNHVRAYYTEAHKDISADYFVQAVVRALGQQRTRRSCYIVFDEVLNEEKEKASAYMSEILVAHKKYQSLNFFTGVIGHQLHSFWKFDDAKTYAEQSTTVVAGPISGQDDNNCFEELRKRAKHNSDFNRPISADELAGQGKGKFIFLPYTSTKQEYPMSVTLPELKTPFRDKPKQIPGDWKWGNDVTD
jgi:hypothetical protein